MIKIPLHHRNFQIFNPTKGCRKDQGCVYVFYRTIFLLSLAASLSSCGKPLEKNGSLTTANTHQITDEDRVTRITKGFDATMIECPERIWPDYNWKKQNVYFTNIKTGKAFLWQGGKQSGRRVTPINLASIGPELTQGLYGRSTDHPNNMGLSLDKSVDFQRPEEGGQKSDFLLSLGIHEGFHFFAQSGWTWPASGDGSGSRTVDYPMLSEPRYLRGNLLYHLKEYLKNPSPKTLQRARGLYDLYEEKYAEEAKNIAPTDQTEGTAFYAEIVGTTLAEVGCGADDKTLIAKSIERLQDRLSISSSSDSESYPLGALAGLIMRSTGDYEGWEKKITQGWTPLALLLENISPDTVADDVVLRRKADEIIKQENQRYATSVRPFLDAWKDPSAIAILLKHENLMGSFDTQGFIRHRGTGKKLTLDFAGSFANVSGTGPLLKVKGLTLEDSDHSTVCGSSGWVAYVSKQHIQLDQGTISINNSSITAHKIPMTTKKDSTGRDWICIF